ncbi:MAG TPA: NAD(P)-binding protein [Myxococcota bacterium]
MSTPVPANTATDVDGPVDLQVDVLVIGAGPSGLGTAAFLEQARRAGSIPSAVRCVVVDGADEPGGYCRTVEHNGFVFDYAGHFFHFRDPAMQAFVLDRLPADGLRTVQRRARVIDVDGEEVGFPYQQHIGELSPAAFRACLVDLYDAERASTTTTTTTTFKQWLRSKLGASLCERFLEPYNEKLYATDLDTLDATCMGRFFPTVRFADVMQALRAGGDDVDRGYNATFTYPPKGAATVIAGLQRDLDPRDLLLNERVVGVDVERKIAVTTKRRIRWRALVSSAPLPQLLSLAKLDVDRAAFSWNRVLVFNLGFDKKARADAHWIYVARADVPFYRVGFYDVIVGGDRASLYVEIGLPQTGDVDAVDLAALREQTLAGLRTLGFIDDTHNLVAEHHVIMDPAYVHLTPRALTTTTAALATLRAHDVHSIGRYGAWTYCSIEDNLIAARDVVTGPLTALLR